MIRTVRARWLNSTVFGIGMASLFSDLSHEVVTSLLPTLLASMGAAAGVLGTIEAVSDGLSSLAKLYGGWWTDRLRRRKPLCATGYGAMAAATAVIASAASWPMVLTGRSLAWFARGLRTPARKALLAEAVTPQTYGRAFGFERTMDTLGAVLAPLAALGFIGIGVREKSVLWLSVLPACLAAAAIIVLVHETKNRTPIHRPLFASLRGLPARFILFLRAVGLFGTGDFAHSLMILYATMALRIAHGAAGAAAIAVGLYAVHNVCYAGISYPAGILADRLNKWTLLGFGYACGAGTALLLALNISSIPGLLAAFILGGVYVGIEETLEDSLGAELLPSVQRGTGFGALATVNGIGDFISSLLVGWLWSVNGPSLAFGFAAIVMGSGTALVIWEGRRQVSSGQ
jgi:MFS family permease